MAPVYIDVAKAYNSVEKWAAEQKAESAHSYLSKLGETKAKIKTRPDQPVDTQPLSTSGNLKTRLLGAFGSRDRAIKEIEDPQQSKNSHM